MRRALLLASRLRIGKSTTRVRERASKEPVGAAAAGAAARALLLRRSAVAPHQQWQGRATMATQQQPATKERGPPAPPGPEDCCQSGCKVCVWDIYRDELKAYNRRLLEEDPSATPVAEAEQAALASAGMDAFEALERQLQQQQKQQQQQQQQQQGEKKS